LTFDLTTIGILFTAALLYSALLPPQWRGWSLMIGSVVAIYWLQPLSQLRYADFVLPTATIALAVGGWYVTRKPDDDEQKQSWPLDMAALGLVLGLVVGMACFRYIAPDFRLTASRPPNPLWVAVGLVAVQAPLMASRRVVYGQQRRTLMLMIGLVVLLFVFIKATPLVTTVSYVGRTLTGQDTALAGSVDFTWLGFSYVAFRLIHTFRDRQSGLLPALSLREYLTYIIFFPAYLAGPIDRAEHFKQELAGVPEMPRLDANRFTIGTGRIAVGIFKKFVIADTLAIGLSLNPALAEQVNSTVGMWVLLYGYALRLFFDFSGYTDIAIGLGILFGIRLPENFKRPYTKTSITTFWQSWHITLSNWARFYVFSPLSRGLLRRKPKPNPMLIVLLAHAATMLTIGLWHGITWNFAIWGAWHALGLFVHKQWSDRTRKWYRGLKDKPLQRRAWNGFAWFVTFHFVVLGWVWFALPEVGQSLTVFSRLFGVGN